MNITKTYIDQMGRSVEIPFPPKRIISLVPSQTELLFELGLEQEMQGITKFCVHPEKYFNEKTKIGGTKNFNFERIDALQPDLIIGNKEENYQEGITALAQKYPVWMSDIVELEDAWEMMRQIGKITQREEQAEKLVNHLEQDFATYDFWLQGFLPQPLKVAYFIWRKPWMVAGSGTFIDKMLKKAGFENVFGDIARYPEVDLEQMKTLKPDWILLSSEPYPFKEEKHFAEIKEIYPKAKIKLIDGELFSWYGSRLRYSTSYFKKLLKSLWRDERIVRDEL
jgi:ABC-type Fe3+-hydroxamate transport system substrate-binding protein